MSVYIPGMEMPNRNTAYAVLFRVNADGTAQLQGSYADDFGSYEAIPVPDHGDLIERDALVVAYDAEHVGPPGRARELMMEAPAIIPADKEEER